MTNDPTVQDGFFWNLDAGEIKIIPWKIMKFLIISVESRQFSPGEIFLSWGGFQKFLSSIMENDSKE